MVAPDVKSRSYGCSGLDELVDDGVTSKIRRIASSGDGESETNRTNYELCDGYVAKHFVELSNKAADPPPVIDVGVEPFVSR
jgi:hypothetical protein